ncbi:MAG: iron ABC transporter permease, partial [Synergistaceae bacterium]|nr:iron ABC transporter permease [Synergistaceae bacterium]
MGKSKKSRGDFIFIWLGLLLFVCSSVALASGRFAVPFAQVLRILASTVARVDETWTGAMRDVVLIIRLPRVAAAILAGSALALSGGAYQGVFKKPLVSPDLLGVSEGAGVGASIAILTHLPGWCVQLFAFISGMTATLLAISLPRLMRNRTVLMLVLSGIIISGFMGAVQGILKYMADSESELPSIVFWLMGSLSATKWASVASTAPAMLPAACVLLLLRWRVNLLSLDDIEAMALGVNVNKLRGLVIVCSTVLTASAVCLSGTIGWVGLIIPHLSRLIAGEDNRRILPVSALLGASFLVMVDTLARNLVSTEIPLSILTGL